MKVLIAGGGIGGLTAALCLLRDGHEVSIFEAAPQLSEIGAGIQSGANAVKVLGSLGLQDELERVSVHAQAIRFRLFDTGEMLHETPLGEAYAARYGAPYLHVHRADLHQILSKAVLEAAPHSVHLNARAVGFDERDDGVTLQLADGRTAEGDLLVGADGVRSEIRNLVLGETPASFTGNVAWRATVEASRLPPNFMEHVVTSFVGPRKHMIMYYLRRGEIFNMVGVVENETWLDESWTVKGSWEDLKADYAGWAPMVQTVIDAVDRDACYRWALYDRKPRARWSTHRVTLLGDAAHAPLPFMGSGAAMAIEDSRILARSLGQEPQIAAALDLYQRNRYERTSRVVTSSALMGRVYHQPDADAFRRQFAAVRKATAGSDVLPDQWLAEYDANTVELV